MDFSELDAVLSRMAKRQLDRQIKDEGGRGLLPYDHVIFSKALRGYKLTEQELTDVRIQMREGTYVSKSTSQDTISPRTMGRRSKNNEPNNNNLSPTVGHALFSELYSCVPGAGGSAPVGDGD